MKKIKTIITICIAITIFILYFIYKIRSKEPTPITIPTPIALPLTIIKTTPEDKSTGTSVFDPITIKFNQKIEASSLFVFSEPAENWTILQKDSSTVYLNHELYLKTATNYTLTLRQKDNNLKVLSFETDHEQNDPRLLQILKSEVEKDYPLAEYTPYENNKYKIIYDSPLTINIMLKTPIDTESAISEAKLWVKSHNIDPLTHKYKVTK